ncbi:hypothetical protein J3E72DRAFT_434913 [Bipolaris maydis]|nr:hypothetical protein J3E72DRAFT_434913 [Bipolaris maydis]
MDYGRGKGLFYEIANTKSALGKPEQLLVLYWGNRKCSLRVCRLPIFDAELCLEMLQYIRFLLSCLAPQIVNDLLRRVTASRIWLMPLWSMSIVASIELFDCMLQNDVHRARSIAGDKIVRN